MKAKLFSVVAIPALVMASASAFAAVEGETGTVNFTGSIKENTCVLDSESVTKTVNLNDVETSVFQQQGAASQEIPFSIVLKDCDPTKATLTFKGETENDISLKVNGGAKGVGVQILESGNPIKVDGSAASSQKEITTGGAEWNFGARYVALTSANGIEGGAANATAQYTVNYE